MKIKHFLLAVVLLGGLVSSLNLHASASYTAPSCSGSGQDCAQSTDGTIYYKGLDQ